MAEADPATPPKESAAMAPPESETPASPRRSRRLLLMISLPLALLIGAGIYWWSLQGKVSTDNAYVQQDKVSIGAEVGGVFTLFAISFFLMGVILFSIGLLGEYIGRIYDEVKRRPVYLVACDEDRSPLREPRP